jgi:ABC-type branched-subunit amino acid transport system ATPase component
MSELLRITGLKGGYKEGVEILHGIDMTVQRGEAVGIIGLNGSGKSTLGKAIMNMIPFREGEIEFDGESITSLSTYQLARKRLSIMQQGGQVFPNLSVWENLELAFPMGMGRSFHLLSNIIPMLQLPKNELQHKMADKLSGGQKHQLALAMALAAEPKLVILDEPSAGLSPKAVEEMYEILRAVRESFGVTILLIEQNVAKAVEFCNVSHIISSGTVKTNDIKDLSDCKTMLFD